VLVRLGHIAIGVLAWIIREWDGAAIVGADMTLLHKTLPPEARQVLVAVNPHAGRRFAESRVERLEQVLRRQGLGVEVLTDLELLCRLANQLHAQGVLRAVVGVGGDGTAAELVNRTDPGVPITLLPSGTANLLARHLHLSSQPEELGRMIATGTVRQLDAGRAAGRIFLLMVGCGFDAEVVRQVHTYRQTGGNGGHIGYRSYLKPILQAIRSYRYPEIRIYWDQSEASVDIPASLAVRWAFVFNLPCYGWGLPLAPAAVATDGLLDLCTFARGSLWHAVRYLATAQCGCHQRLADCTVRRVRRLRLTSEAPVAYQLDGDPGGVLPLEVETLPGRLTLVVPGP
jgi:diacylglycerol kinase family enzyme